MIDISTSFVGLQLKSPIIVGSSGLTRPLDKVKSFAEAGAGAVILKSLFEEQIEAQIGNLNNYNDYTEGAEYLAHYVKADEVMQYLELIRRYKAELDIPVIASICCMRSSSWLDYAAQVQEAGADAIEIFDDFKPNLVILDINLPHRNGIEICEEIRNKSGVPIIVLSARDSEVDKLTLFDLGVDDYVAKPFSARELMARISAILKRSEIQKKSKNNSKTLTF